MAIANVALTNTFDEWRTRTNQIIVSLDQNDTITTAAFVKANVANSNFTGANILSRLITVDGSGSGLDADLLDGLNSSSFLRSDTSDSFDGGTIRFYTENDTGIEYIPPSQANGLQIFQGTSGNDAFMSFYISGEYGIHFGLDSDTQDLSVGGWSKGSNKYKVWHQGNDGVSSGLDADLLDGQQGTYYLAASSYTASDVLSKILTVDGSGSGLDADLLDGQQGSYYSPLTVSQAAFSKANTACTSADTAQTTAVAAFAKANTVDTAQTTAVAAFAKANTAWTASNDGSGSGLDADLLDGYQASAFARYATAPDFSGRVIGRAQSSGDYGLLGYSYNTAYFGIVGYGNYAFYGIGDFYTGGQILATSNITAYYSDKRLKTEITPINNAISMLSRLNGVYYKENDLAKSFGYDNDNIQIGVLAQEVQAVIPDAVSLAPFDIEMVDGKPTSKSGENYLTVKYEKIVPLLIEAIKEQQKEIELLKSKVGV